MFSPRRIRTKGMKGIRIFLSFTFYFLFAFSSSACRETDIEVYPTLVLKCPLTNKMTNCITTEIKLQTKMCNNAYLFLKTLSSLSPYEDMHVCDCNVDI